VKAGCYPDNLGGRHLWARDYFAITSVSAADAVVDQYTENKSQIEIDRDDDFTME
jgi:hypothetical protein